MKFIFRAFYAIIIRKFATKFQISCPGYQILEALSSKFYPLLSQWFEGANLLLTVNILAFLISFKFDFIQYLTPWKFWLPQNPWHHQVLSFLAFLGYDFSNFTVFMLVKCLLELDPFSRNDKILGYLDWTTSSKHQLFLPNERIPPLQPPSQWK